MSKSARLLSPRPLLLSSSSTQSLCRRSALDALVRPTRQRLLYTTRPLCATIVTSATAAGFLPSTDAALSSASSSSSSKPLKGSGSNLGMGTGGREIPGMRLGRAEVLRIPSKEDTEEAELDVEVLPPEDCNVLVTERAADQLRRISTRENDPDVALRISVESGGCHGYQYKLTLTSVNERQPDDYHFAHPTLRPSNILVDAVSIPLLKGSTLDFVTELIGSSFRVSDNPQAKGSGCGCGVSWELKI
ncbi:ISA2 [Sanghuangporus weigelae]